MLNQQPNTLYSQDEMERVVGREYRDYAESVNWSLDRPGASLDKPPIAGHPQNYNGNCYQGPAALALELKMLADRLNTPIFLTRDQMVDLGVEPAYGKEGVSVLHRDVVPDYIIRTKVYALEQTTFVDKYPEYYEKIKGYFDYKKDFDRINSIGSTIIGSYEEDVKKNIPARVHRFCAGWNISTERMSDMERLMKGTLIGASYFESFMFDIRNMTPSDMFRRVNEAGLAMFTKQKECGAIVQKGVNVDELNRRIGKFLKAQQEQSQEQSESATRSRGIK